MHLLGSNLRYQFQIWMDWVGVRFEHCVVLEYNFNAFNTIQGLDVHLLEPLACLIFGAALATGALVEAALLFLD